MVFNIYFKYMPYSGLFHNFILATRIMRSYGCNPVCYPELPHTTHNHPLWRSWDAIVDETLIKLEKRSDFVIFPQRVKSLKNIETVIVPKRDF